MKIENKMVKCDNCGRIYHDVNQVSTNCKKCGIGMCSGCGYYNNYICDDCAESEGGYVLMKEE